MIMSLNNIGEDLKALGVQLTKINEQSTLVIFLGCLGDFDSFEYAFNIKKYLKLLYSLSVNIKIIAIGNQESKTKFCLFHNLPLEIISVVPDNSIHKKIGLSKGLDLGLSPIFNMLMMCAGIGSPGTIKEVIRGYLGDRNSDSIYAYQKDIHFPIIGDLSPKLIDLLGANNYLRPLELATFRLSNMLEILCNWSVYNPYINYITQRGGTFILNQDKEIIYKYCSTSLLIYSINMSCPMKQIINVVSKIE
tara:strand:+ start:1044 stop:1790 length:747 start_codon:yes stop_codon:yes gene_type:complete